MKGETKTERVKGCLSSSKGREEEMEVKGGRGREPDW